VPTIAEAGVPGFQVIGWYGVIGPARMPKEIVTTLSNELVRVVRKPDVRTKLQNAGAEPAGSQRGGIRRIIAGDYAKWSKVIRATGISVE